MTIFFYIAINLLMVMGLAPVVGIPLPAGEPRRHSSMLTVMICVGAIMAIERWSRRGGPTACRKNLGGIALAGMGHDSGLGSASSKEGGSRSLNLARRLAVDA